MPTDYFKLQQILNEKRFKYKTVDRTSGEETENEIDLDNQEKLQAHVKDVDPSAEITDIKEPARRKRVGNETNPRFGGNPFSFMGMLKQKFSSVKDDVYKEVLGRLGGDVGLKYAETQIATRGERAWQKNAKQEGERIQKQIDDLNKKFDEADDDAQRERLNKEIEARHKRMDTLGKRYERVTKLAQEKAKRVSKHAADREKEYDRYADDYISIYSLNKALKKKSKSKKRSSSRSGRVRNSSDDGDRITRKDLDAAVRDAVAAATLERHKEKSEPPTTP